MKRRILIDTSAARASSSLVMITVISLMALANGVRADTLITDLGTFQFGTSSKGLAINDAGIATGEAMTGFGALHAFRGGGSGYLTDLGALSGGFSSRGLAIDGSGQVVGRSQMMTSTGGLQTHAFLSSATGTTLTDLGVLTGGNFSEARAINAAGLIAGVANNAAGVMRAVQWVSTGSGLKAQELGGFWSGGSSEALGINDRGQIVGRAETLLGVTRAFLYSPSNTPNGIPEFRDMGSLIKGGSSVATDINNTGQATGWSDATGGFTHAFIYQDGSMVDIHSQGFLGSSFGLALNNAGAIVGRFDPTQGASRAFLWDSADGMIDLNTLVVSNSGWYLTAATGINSLGQIVGYGTLNGQPRGFLLTRQASGGGGDGGGTGLTETPEPSSIVLFSLGALGLALAHARRKHIARN